MGNTEHLTMIILEFVTASFTSRGLVYGLVWWDALPKWLTRTQFLSEERQMENQYKDKYLTCLDCGFGFCWTAGEQAFYTSKGLTPPKRCPECRVQRKATICRDTRIQGVVK